MGVADSRFRDRVIFVEGAPRSGTTLLAALLATHPRVAGIASESHLFDRGADRLFDNHEGAGASWDHLSAFVSRAELVDLVRELGDGVLERMRAETKPEADFLLEKTPAPSRGAAATLARKVETYPDAWYVHVVRDGEEVAESLMRAPWNPEGTLESSRRWWREGVAAIRAQCGTGRYRELAYERLSEDPVGSIGELWRWLGLDVDDALAERVGLLAQERYAELTGPPPRGDIPRQDAGDDPPERRRTFRFVRQLLGDRRRALRRRSVAAVADAFAKALRGVDLTRLAKLTQPGLELVLATGAGDVRATGDAARDELARFGHLAFGVRFLNETWAVAGGRPFATVLFSGTRPDGRRVDLTITVVVVGGLVARVRVVSAGDPAGRPPRALGDGGPDGEIGHQRGGSSGSP